ncbi:flagellin [Mangrovicoccus ximenensis]|uniref:flagellin n=1 Tax=Mangrovicoccus ximenensis TaxID=1911570 RepID=UPI001374D41B|nr:flagellin [Mangrovicoccus ximenensis]
MTEVGTGEVSNPSAHLFGNFSDISFIEHGLKVGEGFRSVINSARTLADAQQTAFSKARSRVHSVGVALVDTANSVDENKRSAVLHDAKVSFDAALSALNSQVSGRSIFSGIMTQSAAFSTSEQILSSFLSALGSASTAAEVRAAADVWFGIGGDYEMLAYFGSDEALDGFRVADGEVVRVEMTGYDYEVRNLLKLYAVSALMADGQPPLPEQEKSNLMAEIGQDLLNLDRDLISREAEMGSLQARIDEVLAENSSEMYALREYRKDMLGKDVAEAVVELNQVQGQLEALYMVTSRVSGLSLAKFL